MSGGPGPPIGAIDRGGWPGRSSRPCQRKPTSLRRRTLRRAVDVMVVLLGPVGGQLGPFLVRDGGGDLREFLPDRLMLRGWLGLAGRWLLRLRLLLLQPLDE